MHWHCDLRVLLDMPKGRTSHLNLLPPHIPIDMIDLHITYMERFKMQTIAALI